MSTAVPAKQLSEIVSDLSRLLEKPDFDAFELRRLEIAVQRLWDSKSILPAEYYSTKAFFAIAKQQRQNALDAAINAVRLAPNDPITGMNALNIFVGIFEVDQAIPLMKSLAKNHSDDKNCLKGLIVKAADIMQFNLIHDLFKQLDILSVNDGPVKSVHRELYELTLNSMIRYGLTDEDIASRIKVVAQTLQKKGLDVFRSTRRALSDGAIMHYMHVNASIELCAELNFDIADALVEQFEDPCGEFVSFACRPWADLSKLDLSLTGTL